MTKYTTAGGVNALLHQGQALHQHGRLAEARLLYKRVLARQPKNFDALNLLGVVAAQEGNFELAAEWMGKALEISPDRALLRFNHGAVLQQLGRTEDAMVSFERAIAINPGFAEAHFNLGLALRTLNRTKEALASFQRNIAINPDSAESHAHCGDLFQECKQTAEALASYDRAIALNPNFAETHFNHGVVLQELKRTEEALASYDRAVAIKPDYAAAYSNRGIALHRLSRSQEAFASFDRAIDIKPDYATAYSNRGIALHELNRTEEALASYERAIAISPEFVEPIWNKSLALLSLGNFEQGWHFYEWRWKRANQADLGVHYQHAQPLWLGEQALAGKTILLHAEQGLGDTVQFCRYAKRVKAFGATVILEVPKALTGLLSGLEGVDRVIEQGRPLHGFDYHCPLMSLPLAFKTRLDTIPSSERYLFAEPKKADSWRQRLGVKNRPRVGLVWSGGFRPEQPELWAENQRRNLPFELLGLLNGLDVDFISLQKGEPAESEFAAAMRAGWTGPALADYSAELHDFADTAALIENLDHVIAVDTSVAHVAAALGKPVWILNRFDNCWRWLQDRVDSPWYPTVKLYNQARAGDWVEVMHRVRNDLVGFKPASQPQDVSALLRQGLTLQQQGRLAEAGALYAQVLASHVNNFDALYHSGMLALQTSQLTVAVELLGKAIEIRPTQADLHFNRGVALQKLKRTEEAIASFDRTIALKPDHVDALFNRGIALQALKRTKEALACYDRAITIKPDDAEIHFNRGISLRALQRFEDAVASYDRAITISPEFAEPYWNKSLLLLLRGNFEQGWALHEWRWKRAKQLNPGARYQIAQPLWLGEQALAGKTILLHAEQGLGDTIQFCRYAKRVKALGATVILEVPKVLTGLLSGLEGVDRVIEQGSPLPGFDYHCPLMSLPLAFKTRLDTIPSSERYLSADPSKSAHWKQKLGPRGRLRIGLVWSGGFRPEQPELWAENQRRNLPFELLGILNSLDVDFISLQKGEPAESEFAAATRAGWAGPAIADYSAEIQDFTDTAALIESLDLVISVDTSVAHLAAALGRPVWILNRFDNCWRWLQNREDSPWYPTVKLYKQARAGDWGEVMRRVRHDVISLVT